MAPDRIPALLEDVRTGGQLSLLGQHPVQFSEKRDFVFNKREKLPLHPNGMRFSAFAGDGRLLLSRDYYSVGGGFVLNPDEAAADRIVPDQHALPYPFRSAEELLSLCEREG